MIIQIILIQIRDSLVMKKRLIPKLFSTSLVRTHNDTHWIEGEALSHGSAVLR